MRADRLKSLPDKHISVYLLSFSAFFADMGYQIVVGGLSVFLVLVLHAPIWVFALIEAFSYGSALPSGQNFRIF